MTEPNSQEPRYFVDERVGCIAVRDRVKTDPEYPGLHHDTEGVVWYAHGTNTVGEGWALRDADKEHAEKLCAELNNQPHAQPAEREETFRDFIAANASPDLLAVFDALAQPPAPELCVCGHEMHRSGPNGLACDDLECPCMEFRPAPAATQSSGNSGQLPAATMRTKERARELASRLYMSGHEAMRAAIAASLTAHAADAVREATAPIRKQLDAVVSQRDGHAEAFYKEHDRFMLMQDERDALRASLALRPNGQASQRAWRSFHQAATHAERSRMNLADDEIRVKCAEAMGWTNFRTNQFGYKLTGTHPQSATLRRQCVPDYPNSLDACAELRASLTEGERHAFAVIAAYESFPNGWQDWRDTAKLLEATPAQICKWFLKAKGVL